MKIIEANKKNPKLNLTKKRYLANNYLEENFLQYARKTGRMSYVNIGRLEALLGTDEFIIKE